MNAPRSNRIATNRDRRLVSCWRPDGHGPGPTGRVAARQREIVDDPTDGMSTTAHFRRRSCVVQTDPSSAVHLGDDDAWRITIDGRRWRRTDPVSAMFRKELVDELMSARCSLS
jgi:hypothetical protein